MSKPPRKTSRKAAAKRLTAEQAAHSGFDEVLRLIDAAKGASAALGFEDGAGDPKTAVVSRRSAGSWTLRTTGTPAHSGQIFKPEVGAGAVYEASRILHEFYTRLSNEQYLTFNPGLIVGGTLVKADTTGTEGSAAGKRNVVAEHAEVFGDLRALSPESGGFRSITLRTRGSTADTSSAPEVSSDTS